MKGVEIRTNKDWTEQTGAIGIVAKAGRCGGTYAYQDIAKAKHAFQADAIRAELVPGKMIGSRQEGLFFANEADLLKMVLFGQTAKAWKATDPKGRGN
ncbi:MAG: hypothetical protein AAFV95_28505 [Bacteroidota bacterium]